jgi:thiol-disulfide isomerase/thioredoxin
MIIHANVSNNAKTNLKTLDSMTKVYLLGTFLIFAISAYSQEDLMIKLDTVSGYGVFYDGQFIIWPLKSKVQNMEIPSNLVEYCIRKVDFQSYNTLFQLVKKEELSKDDFDNYVNNYSLNQQLITDQDYNHSLYILIGKTSQNEYIVVLDKNNNQSFSDDEKFILPIFNNTKDEEDAMEKLPTTLVDFEYYNGFKIIKKTLPIRINPYKGTLGITMNADSIEQKYFLAISFPFYRHSKLSINNKSYEIFLTNGFSSIDYTKKNTRLIIKAVGDKNKTEKKGAIPYSIGDIVSFDSSQYEFSRASTYGDTLGLKFFGFNKFPEGFQEGQYIPKMKTITIDRQLIDLADFKGKYILLDFWGTWCGPCIKLIPQIKDLYEKYKHQDFVLISIANDNNIENVKQFINRNQMDWPQVIQNNSENDIITKLKISQYPTMMLIGPNGQIISRGKEIKEIDNILTNVFIK